MGRFPELTDEELDAHAQICSDWIWLPLSDTERRKIVRDHLARDFSYRQIRDYLKGPCTSHSSPLWI